MPLPITRIHSPNLLKHHDASFSISNRPMLHALGHFENIADFQLHRLICSELIGVLRRGRFRGEFDFHRTARDAIEELVCLWVAVPDERALDLGDFESVRRIHCHEMFRLPLAFDLVDALGEVGGFHDWVWLCLSTWFVRSC